MHYQAGCKYSVRLTRSESNAQVFYGGGVEGCGDGVCCGGICRGIACSLTFSSFVRGLDGTAWLGLDGRLTFVSGKGEVCRIGEMFDGDDEAGTVILILGFSLGLRMRSVIITIRPITPAMIVRISAKGV